MVKVRGRNSNGKTVKQTVKNGRKISGDDAARPAWVMVPGVSSSRLRPDSDQSRIWCRVRPWLGCDSLNELTWVSFVVHWHLTIFFFSTNSSPSAPAHFLSETTFRPGLPWSSLGRNEQNEISLTYMYSLANGVLKVCWCWGRGIGIIMTQQERTCSFFFFFCRFVSVVWQDSDRVQSVTQGTWYSGRSSMLSSDSWLIVDIGERSHPNPMHRSSLFQRDFQNRW